jgi:hypothetical protein
MTHRPGRDREALGNNAGGFSFFALPQFAVSFILFVVSFILMGDAMSAAGKSRADIRLG